MKRLLFIAFLFGALSAFAAASGDISAVTINADGYSANITVASVGVTSSNFYFGYLTNMTGKSRVVFNVTGCGYDTTGASNAAQRVLYGTMVERLAYSSQSNMNLTVSGSDAVWVVALSDYVYTNELVTYSIAAGALVSGGVTNNAGSGTATTSSTVPYNWARPIVQWSWPDLQYITGTTYPLRLVAFHRHAKNGSEVAAVKFRAWDAHNHTNTCTAVQMVDRSIGDASPIVEYVGTMSTAGFTSLDWITNNADIYPWVGDSSSVVSTDDGKYTTLMPYYHPQRYFFDSGAAQMWYAVVDPTNGNDSTGYRTNTFNAAGPPLPFLSITGAIAKIVYSATNESTIYLTNGTYMWYDTHVPTASARTWTVVKPFPGVARSDVLITNITGAAVFAAIGNNLGNLKLENVTYQDGAKGIFYNLRYLWLDQCSLNSTAALFIDGSGTDLRPWYITRNFITAFTQGFMQGGTQGDSPQLIRGNTWNAVLKSWNPYCVVGNVVTNSGSAATLFFDDTTHNPAAVVDGNVIAFNKFGPMHEGSTTFASSCGSSQNKTNGIAFVQNLYEAGDYVAGGGIALAMHADDATGGMTNAIVHNNTCIGARWNVLYNWAGTALAPITLASVKNNLVSHAPSKQDDQAPNQNAAKIGGWAWNFGAGISGNAFYQPTNYASSSDATAQFLCDFQGLNSYVPALVATLPPSSAQTTPNFPLFVDYQAWMGYNTNNNGGGNYRMLSATPFQANGWQSDWLLGFDVEGNNRGALDPPGVYASAVPRKGAGFFGQ